MKRYSTRDEKEALTNIIQLVRFAFHQIEKLESLYPSAGQRFNLWCGQIQRPLSSKQIELMHEIQNFIASNGYCAITEIKENDKSLAAQLIKAFAGKEMANEALSSLAQFIIYRKVA